MLERKARDFIIKHNLLPAGSRILAGVSGGPDSLALLSFLRSVRDELELELVCAHVDHMFRGQESYGDYLFVEQICKEWDIPFEGKRADVPAFMAVSGESTQLAARRVRYGFFEEVMAERKLGILALGHHGDDQVETMLMRMTRGAAGAARAGIPADRPFAGGRVVRPFLTASRTEIADYLSRQQLVPRLDPSNDRDDYVRNRFRHHVLPFLKEENPLVHEHFQRFSEEMQEEGAYLNSLAEKEAAHICKEKSPGYVRIDLPALSAIPMPLQRRVIHLILSYLYIERPSSLSALHIDQLMALFLNPHPSAELSLPAGLTARKSYSACIFTFSGTDSPVYSLTLQIPGETILPNGYKIEAHYIKEEVPPYAGNDSFIASGQLFPLTVRTREPGDKMEVKGLGGSKKLKGIFINEKIPRQERDSWPVVTDRTGNIIWLPGLKKSELERVPVKDEQPYVYLEYIKLNSSWGANNNDDDAK